MGGKSWEDVLDVLGKLTGKLLFNYAPWQFIKVAKTVSANWMARVKEICLALRCVEGVCEGRKVPPKCRLFTQPQATQFSPSHPPPMPPPKSAGRGCEVECINDVSSLTVVVFDGPMGNDQYFTSFWQARWLFHLWADTRGWEYVPISGQDMNSYIHRVYHHDIMLYKSLLCYIIYFPSDPI